MATSIKSILVLCCLAISAQAQFYDNFFQDLQPFLQTIGRNQANYFTSTARPELNKNSKNNNNHDNANEDKRINNDNITNLGQLFGLQYYTTTPRSKKPNDRTTRRRNQNKKKENKNHEKQIYTDVNNDYSTRNPFRTTKSEYQNNVNNYYEYNTNENNDRHENVYSRPNTQKSNKPGVKPEIIVDGPPITNRPATSWPFDTRTTRRYTRPRTTEEPRPTFATTSKPWSYNVKPDAVSYPDTTDDVPEVLSGVDEDTLSGAEKKRYMDMAERMCERYKTINVKTPAAIPLIPSPSPVKLRPTECTPVTLPLVVGGEVVSIKDYPHMGLLGWKKTQGGGYSWKCGGSLVSDQYVLTAAHCVYYERDESVVKGPPRAVQLGSSYLDDPGALVMKVRSVIRHHKYHPPRSYYDIALIKMAGPVTFSQVVKPACLGIPPRVREKIVATGWGLTHFGGDQSKELRSVALPIWDMRSCLNVLGTSRKLPNGPSANSQICAGEPEGGKDTCQGDSGGPALIQDGCVWRIVAVTSLGRSCGAPNTPGLYAKIQRHFVAAHVFGNILDKNSNRQNDNRNNEYSSNDQIYNTDRNRNENKNTNNDSSDNNGAYNSDNSYNNNNNRNVRQRNENNNNRNNNNNRHDVNNDESIRNNNNNDYSNINDRDTFETYNNNNRRHVNSQDTSQKSTNSYYSTTSNYYNRESNVNNNREDSYYPRDVKQYNNDNNDNNNRNTFDNNRYYENPVSHSNNDYYKANYYNLDAGRIWT